MTNSNLPTVSLADLPSILEVVWSAPDTANVEPIILVGAPGTGKTAMFRSIARETLASIKQVSPEQVGYVEIHAGQRDPVEAHGLGLPVRPSDDNPRWSATFTRSPFMQEIEEAASSHSWVIVNFDELLQASPDMIKALRSTFDPHTRRLGGETLPANVLVVGTGNRQRDKSGATRLLSHFANVTLRFEVQFDAEGWAQWAQDHALHPSLIAATLTMTESDTPLFADAVPVEDVQFCTPRSYARLASHLTRLAAGNEIPDNLVTRRLAEAAIGQQAAEQMFSFLALAGKVPTAKEIQADPEGAMVHERTDLQHIAAQVALTSAQDSYTADRAITYMMRLRPDLQVALIASLMRKSVRKGWRLSGPAAVDFITRHRDLLPDVG